MGPHTIPAAVICIMGGTVHNRAAFTSGEMTLKLPKWCRIRGVVMAWPLLRGQLWVVNSVAAWPISNWEVGKMSWAWVAVYYLVLAICIKYWPWRRQPSG